MVNSIACPYSPSSLTSSIQLSLSLDFILVILICSTRLRDDLGSVFVRRVKMGEGENTHIHARKATKL